MQRISNLDKSIKQEHIQAFTAQPLTFLTAKALKEMKMEVENETENYILGVSEVQYIEHLISKHCIEPLLIDFDADKIICEGSESRLNVRDIINDEPELIFTYHIIFNGDYNFLQYKPSCMVQKESDEVIDRSVNFWGSENEVNSIFYQQYSAYNSPLYERINSSETSVKIYINKYAGYCYNIELNSNNLKENIRNAKEGLGYPYFQFNPKEQKAAVKFLTDAQKWVGTVSDQYIHIEILSPRNKKKEIESDIRNALKGFKRNAQCLSQDIERHNIQIKKSARDFFVTRKKRILKQSSILQAIGYPIKVRGDKPKTFEVSTNSVRRQVLINKPIVPEETYVPEPTLHEAIYQDILKTMYGLGKVIERKPTVYKDKHEEALRDLFLIYLDPRYEGASATGETFNGKGKTDILIRYQKSNVFVAECKVWHGAKNYLDGISQLLGNVVWRDTKTAVVLFVRDESITHVCETVKNVTPTHNNYLGFVSEEQEAWFNYRFHVNGDSNREVKLAVLVFWVPQDEKKIIETQCIHMANENMS